MRKVHNAQVGRRAWASGIAVSSCITTAFPSGPPSTRPLFAGLLMRREFSCSDPSPQSCTNRSRRGLRPSGVCRRGSLSVLRGAVLMLAAQSSRPAGCPLRPGLAASSRQSCRSPGRRGHSTAQRTYVEHHVERVLVHDYRDRLGEWQLAGRAPGMRVLRHLLVEARHFMSLCLFICSTLSGQ